MSSIFAALNIYKPLGLTSHDVVARLRRVYNLKKIGHLGTLDPLAEGVLPVCLGQATRLIEYFPSNKRYTAEITFGKTTVTLDREGEVLSTVDCSSLDFSETRLSGVLQQFTGVIQQQVPLYSAVHVKGKKLYELARAGKTADLPVRETTIYALEKLGFQQDNPVNPVLTVDVQCSSGTYIRSLARDIGDAMGCGAYLSGLIRTEHGKFTVENSVPLEVIQDSVDPSSYFVDPIAYLDLPQWEIAQAQNAKRLQQGMKLEPEDGKLLTGKLKGNACYVAMHKQLPIGIIQYADGRLKPLKNFAGIN